MRKMLLILAALLVLVPASAEAAAEKYRGYTISEKGAIAYNKPNMITGKPRFLFGGSHEARILSIVSTPSASYYVAHTINGEKVYTPSDAFLLKNSGWKEMYTSSKMAAYRRKSTDNRYGTIAKYDRVRVIGRSGVYTQVAYPAPGQKYERIAWIPTASEKAFLTPAPTGIRRKRSSPFSINLGTKVKLTNLVEVLPKSTMQAVRVKVAKKSVMKLDGQYLVPLKMGKTKVTFTTLNGRSCSYTFTVERAKRR